MIRLKNFPLSYKKFESFFLCFSGRLWGSLRLILRTCLVFEFFLTQLLSCVACLYEFEFVCVFIDGVSSLMAWMLLMVFALLWDSWLGGIVLELERGGEMEKIGGNRLDWDWTQNTP